MNIGFLKRLFVACFNETGISYADGLNLFELYRHLDEAAVAEDKVKEACEKAGLTGAAVDPVYSAIYDYAESCELQGFVNGFRLCAKLIEELTEKEAQG